MRIIAGTARRLQLKTVDGLDTRPTTDRIKETLFNILQNDIAGCKFLDLFAGSGQIGLEALSRGAKAAVFVERNQKACACIADNIERTGFSESARLLKMDAISALRALAGRDRFDFIFMDPPYRSDSERDVLTFLKEADLLEPGGQIIVEAALDKDFSYVWELGYGILREKIYKTNKHVFMAREGA